MRSATWLLVLVAIAAIAQADPATGTVIVSCNEADASLIVDGVLVPDRTPAVLTLTVGPHTIEVRKPSLVPDKKVIEVSDQQPVKVRFELLPPAAPPPPRPDVGSAAPPAVGSGAGSGSAAPPAMGSGTGSAPAAGSGAGSGSAGPITALPASATLAKPSRCTEGGHEVACIQGPHCTEGGKPVPCKKGDPLPGATTTPTTTATTTTPTTHAVVASTSGTGAGSAARVEPKPASTSGLEIATGAAHAIAYVDGAPLHDAPCVLALEPGEHVVAVYAAGMVPAETIVHIEAGKHQRVELTPSQPRKRIDVPAQ